MRKLLCRYKEPILYIVFGVLTTLVNILVYYFVADVAAVYYLIANMCAWVAAVLFAFFTNKLFVFQSKSWKGAVVLPELGGFLLARVATGVVDMVLMWLLIDVVRMDRLEVSELFAGVGLEAMVENIAEILSGEMIAKILVNIVVIVLNYVASKLWIFRS